VPTEGLDGFWPVVVTVEHGGNRVPVEYEELFRGRADLLASHRGWDPGTRFLGRVLAARLRAPLVEADVTRLLVDLNRSPHNPRVFSEVSKTLDRAERVALLETLHEPHWTRARRRVAEALDGAGRVLHLGMHSFTPALAGRVRRPDIAFLYDPGRTLERALASAWRDALTATTGRVVRRNDPYRGAADGMTTALRKEYPQERYVGIEVEVNQRHLRSDGRFPGWVADGLVASLERVVALRAKATGAS